MTHPSTLAAKYDEKIEAVAAWQDEVGFNKTENQKIMLARIAKLMKSALLYRTIMQGDKHDTATAFESNASIPTVRESMAMIEAF